SVADRAGLPRRPSALDCHMDVESLRRLRGKERLLDDHLENVVGEVVVEGAFVDRDRAGAGHQANPSHRLLAAPGGSMLDIDRQASSYLCGALAPSGARPGRKRFGLLGLVRMTRAPIHL